MIFRGPTKICKMYDVALVLKSLETTALDQKEAEIGREGGQTICFQKRNSHFNKIGSYIQVTQLLNLSKFLY